MVFSSFDFIFVFLPIFLVVNVFLIRTRFSNWAISWIILSSLVFYSWWDITNLPILLGSIFANFILGNQLRNKPSQVVLLFSCGGNLLVLGWFKYRLFFLNMIDGMSGSDMPILSLIIPLGLSFFTFQQITWLVDSHRRLRPEVSWQNYTMYISFFPQLIAGPIVHHRDVVEQIARGQRRERITFDIMVGLSILIIGLAKKVLIADRLAIFANSFFSQAASGGDLALLNSWIGVLAYTFQLYFDFSAYSDMAIGIARMCGIRLPINFNSPYKATSIIDFWRRWHITLSAFLRDYLYIALGGNRRGITRRYVNIFLTMLIGGFWHGANWTFILWGAVHGILIVANQLWAYTQIPIPRPIAMGVTFILVVFAWVLFRSSDVETGLRIYAAMIYGSDFAHWQLLGNPIQFGPPEEILRSFIELAGFAPKFSGAIVQLVILSGAAMIAFTLPNTAQLFYRFNKPVGLRVAPISWIDRQLIWRPNIFWALSLAILFGLITLNMGREVEFLYFDF